MRKCKCGFELYQAQGMERSAGMESYLVVHDDDYLRFLELEIEATKYPIDSLERIASRASDFAGMLLICPACSRLLLLRAGIWEWAYFVPEPNDCAGPDEQQ